MILITKNRCEYNYPANYYSLQINSTDIEKINYCYSLSTTLNVGTRIVEYYCYEDYKFAFKLTLWGILRERQYPIFKSILGNMNLKYNTSQILDASPSPSSDVYSLAVDTLNISKCKEIRMNCRYTIDCPYGTTGVTYICEDSCICEIAKKTNDIELCNQITKGDIEFYHRDRCIQHFAIQNNDASLCYNISRVFSGRGAKWYDTLGQDYCLRETNSKIVD